MIISIEAVQIALVNKDGSQKCVEIKEINDLFPFCHWLTVPKRAFVTLPQSRRDNVYYILRLKKLNIKSQSIISVNLTR